MHLVSIIRSSLRVIAPASWLAVAILVPLAPRRETMSALALQALGFFGAAFVTRLAIEDHESRYQLAVFVGAAAALEAARLRRPSGRHGSFRFWAAAVAGASIGIVAARPFAHRFGISPW